MFKNLSSLRTNTKRTALGALKLSGWECEPGEQTGYRVTGRGKVTLWPAPIWGEEAAAFPDSWASTGHVFVLFDTFLSRETSPLQKAAGDITLQGSTPDWLGSSSSSVMLRWLYSDPSATTQFTGKKLAGDRISCCRNLEWGF